MIDDALVTSIDDARDGVERAQQALADYLADYPDRVASARQLVAFAEENLIYAGRALDLDERRVGDLAALERVRRTGVHLLTARAGKLGGALRAVGARRSGCCQGAVGERPWLPRGTFFAIDAPPSPLRCRPARSTTRADRVFTCSTTIT